MSQKKSVTMRLQNTLNELDTAIEQWDSITNKPQREQVPDPSHPQKKAKELLDELRKQIEDFDQLDTQEDDDLEP